MQIRYTESAVAFLDVLGYKELVKGSVESQDKLNSLQSLVTQIIDEPIKLNMQVNTDLVPIDLLPVGISISDSIILSAPLSAPLTPYYNGLYVIVMRCIQLAQKFLAQGFLIRGGIDVGLVCHTSSNIVGPAYQMAYEIESKVANDPCILLSEKAEKIFNDNPFEVFSEISIKDINENLCEKKYGSSYLMVNTLHSSYFSNMLNIEQTLDQYQQIISNQHQLLTDNRAKEKWKWFEAYLISKQKKY